MENFYWESIAYYLLLSTTTFYQQLHAKNFQGSSEVFGLLISIFGFAGMLVNLVYLGYYGWYISWWAAVLLLVLGTVVAGIIGFILEKAVGKVTLSMAGFICLPVCTYLMFKALPV